MMFISFSDPIATNLLTRSLCRTTAGPVKLSTVHGPSNLKELCCFPVLNLSVSFQSYMTITSPRDRLRDRGFTYVHFHPRGERELAAASRVSRYVTPRAPSAEMRGH